MAVAERDAGARIARVRWSVLAPHFMHRWDPAEHVAIIGPTRQGKTTLALEILNQRAERRDAHVVVLATKRRDPALMRTGWPIIAEWPPNYEQRAERRVILWPPYGRASTAKANKRVFEHALDEILEEGGWTVYFDEAIYFVETLGLRPLLDEYWNTAGSSGITVVASSQGVTWIPVAMRTQIAWAFVFPLRNEELRAEAAKVVGDRRTFEPVIGQLRKHEFLVVRTLTGEAYVSKVGT